MKHSTNTFHKLAKKTVKKVLLVEDDPELHQNIKEVLEADGYIVSSAFDGTIAERLIKQQVFDCILLDINLPGKNGFELCKSTRLTSENKNTPVLMLTAFSELEDKVEGYEAGADDYLTKPFFMRELLLRIDALMKRSKASSVNKPSMEELTRGDLSINLKTKVVKRAEKVIDLTPREYQILKKLLEADGEFVSKKDLIGEIWGKSFDSNTNTIEVYINFLRAKIDKPFGKKSIKTKVGYGYYFEV